MLRWIPGDPKPSLGFLLLTKSKPLLQKALSQPMHLDVPVCVCVCLCEGLCVCFNVCKWMCIETQDLMTSVRLSFLYNFAFCNKIKRKGREKRPERDKMKMKKGTKLARPIHWDMSGKKRAKSRIC